LIVKLISKDGQKIKQTREISGRNGIKLISHPARDKNATKGLPKVFFARENFTHTLKT